MLRSKYVGGSDKTYQSIELVTGPQKGSSESIGDIVYEALKCASNDNFAFIYKHYYDSYQCLELLPFYSINLPLKGSFVTAAVYSHLTSYC